MRQPAKPKPTGKKKRRLSQKVQSSRFLKTVAELEAAGELNPTDAAASFDRTFRQIVPAKTQGSGPKTQSTAKPSAKRKI